MVVIFCPWIPANRQGLLLSDKPIYVNDAQRHTVHMHAHYLNYQVAVQIGDKQLALRSFEAFAPVLPALTEQSAERMSRILLDMAALYVESRRAKQAMSCLDSVLSFAPEHVDARVARGMMLLRQGDLAAAGVDAEAAMRLAPSSQRAQLLLSQYRAALKKNKK